MSEQNHRLYEFGPFRLDAAKGLLYQAGEVVPLKPKVFETLLVLVEQSGKQDLLPSLTPYGANCSKTGSHF